MVVEKYFTASAELVRRAGIIASRYRTKDGRYIINGGDLNKISHFMTPQEFIGGIDVVEVTKQEAKGLISENGYHMGELYEKTEEQSSSEDSETQTNEEEE